MSEEKLLDLRAYFGAPGQARRFQRVRFPLRKGNEPSHRESSLGLMKVRYGDPHVGESG
jgi:hypothetical protein